MNERVTYSPEVRERAVRMVLTSEHEHSLRWAALVSVSSKIGCTPEALRAWVDKINKQGRIHNLIMRFIFK